MSTQEVKSQVQDKKFISCLVVSRHEILISQKRDIENICSKVEIIPELPTNKDQLKEVIGQYDVVIGSFPLSLQIDILQNKKTLIMFAMKSLGTADSEEEANKIASRYPDRSAILTPSKGSEKFRVVLYEGLKMIKEIKVVDEWVVNHQD